ncbi:hypothetical protein, partial [Olavius algarvensis spirochete endosymbiont]|uniref:hypothetical protein n=1 Tax=Olavius algarvensis spirochete endosymbiont TaxID=260710 RepID=UPI0011CE0698
MASNPSADPGRSQVTHVLEGDAQDLGATAEADLLLLDGLAHQPGQAVLDTIDAIIDDFRKDISKVGSFDDASNRILNRHKRQF